MKINMKLSIILILCLYLSSNIIAEEINKLDGKGVIIDFKDGKNFGIGFRTDAYEQVKSFKEGTLNRYSNDPNNNTNLGIFCEIKVAENNTDYYVIYAMLSELNNNLNNKNLMKQDEIIGKTGPTGPLTKIFTDANVVIAVYTFNKNIELESLSGSPAFKQFGVYWYNPSFIMNRKTVEKSKYDESRYKKIELNEFIELFNKSPGRSEYGAKLLNMKIDLQNMPVPIDENDYKNIVEVHKNANVNDQKFIDLYKYKIELIYEAPVDYCEKCKINLYIQSELVPFIMNEYNLKDLISINFIMSYIDTFNQEASLLITGIGY